VEEEDNRYVVVADLAGFSPEEVNVELRNQQLVISASHEEKEGDEKKGRSRRRSDIYQSLTLPQDVNIDDIKADFKHGELCVYLPRSESAKPRKIAISGSSERTSKPSISASSTAPDDGQNFDQSRREKSAS
jgi:HSP20 family protein